MNEVKNKKKKKRKISRIISLILLMIVIIFLITLLFINVIPFFYLLLILIIFLIILFAIVLLNFNKKRIFRLLGYLLSILLSVVLVCGEVYLVNTLGFLLNTTTSNYSLKNYNVLVLKKSKYIELEDLNNKKIGINSNNETVEQLKKKIKKEIKTTYKTYIDLQELVDSLVNNKIDAIVLEDSELDLLKEENLEKYNSLKSIYKFEIKQNIKSLMTVSNINKEPFNIYISGIDTYGKINSSSRSDVNIVLTINPKSEKVLITWIPRDYYVNINDSEFKDKLTHAGIYGIDSSIYAVEKLLNVDINYYVKVNFTSVIDVVDLLGGIEVYNDETFQIENGNVYKKGNLKLTGEQALEFVRERKSVTGGDLGRGKNQIKVLEALIDKAMSKNIIKSYNSLLNSLADDFVTNMSQSTMTTFIKKEINRRRDWKIESNILTGTDSYEYSYTYKNSALYVMKPDIDSVKNAKDKINEIIKNTD